MFNLMDDSNDFMFDVLGGEIISLESEYYVQARDLSKKVPQAQKWQKYLNTLALLGFKEWLKEREGNIKVNESRCSIFQPQSELEVVYGLEVEQFKFCLIVTESLIDRIVTIPVQAILMPEYAAHFYVAIEIWKEEKQASIRGFLRYDRLKKMPDLFQSTAEDSTKVYQISLDRFDLNINHLLMSLSLANPVNFGLPERQPTPSLMQKASDIVSRFQEKLELIAEGLNWGEQSSLIPATAAGFRCTAPFDSAIADLIDRGLKIPRNARGSCKNVEMDDITLQLLVSSWPSQTLPELKSSLLLMLRAEDGGYLPEGIKLQVKDLQQIITEKIATANQRILSLYIEENLENEFFITIVDNEMEQIVL